MESRDGGSHDRSTDRGAGTTRTSRRRLVGAAAAGVLGTTLGGCIDSTSRSSDRGDEVRIGVLVGGTGTAQTTAAKVAAAEINDDGGLLGRDVTVVTAETKSSPLEARRSYHRLVLEEDVDVTMGISTANVLDHLLDDFAEQELVHFTTGSGTLTPTEHVAADYENYKYHFRTGPVNHDHLIENQFAFIADMGPRLGWNSVGILSEAYPWTEEFTAAFEQQLPRFGLDVPYSHRYQPARDDFGSIYDDLEDAGVDAVWVAMGHTGTHAVAQWARERRPFEFGGTHIKLQYPDYYDGLNGAPRYTFTQTAATSTSELTPLTEDFVERYRAESGGDDPVYTSYNTYDSIVAYANAVRAARTFDTDAVIDELEALDIQGTTGRISYYDEEGQYPHDRKFDPENDTHSGSVFFQWQEGIDGDGVQEVIWPEEYTTTEYTSPPWI